jgi:ureidoglycolate lyase
MIIDGHSIPLEPLTTASFSPFGTCITSPLPRSTNTVPKQLPTPYHPDQQPQPIYANQNTALKASPISPLINNYPSTPAKPPSKPLMSMFSCFPRPPSTISSGRLPIKILERHPYTTQTFSPLGIAPADQLTCFLVVVAPSLSVTVKGVVNPPDLAGLKAFYARGDQAVTYSAGTWHAPMIVLGEKRVDFVVTQFVNGVAEDDCQEVNVEGVNIDLKSLPLGSERAKL